MNTLTSDTTAAEASFLFGWALYEILDREHPDQVRFPQDDGDWLTAPGLAMFVPVGDGTSVSQFVGSILPRVRAELDRQLADGAPSKDWFIELDYWAHAMSCDSENIATGIRFDVVVRVHSGLKLHPPKSPHSPTPSTGRPRRPPGTRPQRPAESSASARRRRGSPLRTSPMHAPSCTGAGRSLQVAPEERVRGLPAATEDLPPAERTRA